VVVGAVVVAVEQPLVEPAAEAEERPLRAAAGAVGRRLRRAGVAAEVELQQVVAVVVAARQGARRQPQRPS
jgi:hypothetical protein